MLREKFQYVLILAFPAMIIAILILRNPFMGVCMFYIYEFARPDNFFPSLRPLRIAIIIQAVTLLAWIFQLIIHKKSVRWDKFSWAYLFLVGVMAAGVINAEIYGYALDYTQEMFSAFIIFTIAVSVTDSLKRIRILVNILLLIHLYFAIKGVVTGGFVGGSLMGDENDFALALNVMIPFAFFFFLNAKSRIGKTFYLVLLIAFLLGVISSMSRGGWVGMVVLVFYCMIKSKQKLRSIAIVILLGLTAILFAPQHYWEEVESIKNTGEGTAQIRKDYWMAAVRMYIDNPVVGVGAANGGFRMPEYYEGRLETATQWGRTFHGTLPQVLAELGTLGMAAYLFMAFFAFKYLIRVSNRCSRTEMDYPRILANSIMGALLGYFATSAFLSTAYYPQLWTLYTLAICLTFVCRERMSATTDVKDVARIAE
jgi:probable O-glycosylation ligase (exosortase A-associated)